MSGDLKHPMPDPRLAKSVRGAYGLGALALGLALIGLMSGRGEKSPGRSAQPDAVVDPMVRVRRDGVLRAGYGGFPPYTVIDARETDPDKRVTGYSVDLVREIARRQTPPLKVEWVRFNWDTMKVDMASGKFDFIADPVFQTIPRAVDFRLCRPYSHFGIAVAVVRKDDDRFKAFGDLDRPGITIALAEGWTSSEYARANLTKPTFKSIPVTGDAFNQLDEVLLGRADVALNDVPTVAQYVRAHADKVKALWLDRPPSSVVGGFLTSPENESLAAFLDAGIEILRADGTLRALDARWKTFGFFLEPTLQPGAGLAARP